MFSHRPLYLQVRDMLFKRIESGAWKASEPIPSEALLAREWGVSLGTVRKALSHLEKERLLIRRQGRGTFVVDQTSGEMAVRFSNLRDLEGARILGDVLQSTVTRGSPGAEEREELQLEPNAVVLRIERIRQYADRPFMTEVVVLPEARFPSLKGREEFPPRIVVLAQENGLLLSKAREAASAVPAPRAVAHALAIAEGTPILRLVRTVYARRDLPIEWRLAFCHLVEARYIVEIE